MAKVLLGVIGRGILKTQNLLKAETDKSVRARIQKSMEIEKKTYAALMVFIYKNNPTTAERVVEIATQDFDWARLIHFHSASDKHSLELFSTLFDKFLSQNGFNKKINS